MASAGQGHRVDQIGAIFYLELRACSAKLKGFGRAVSILRLSTLLSTGLFAKRFALEFCTGRFCDGASDRFMDIAPDDAANQAIVNKFLDASKTQQDTAAAAHRCRLQYRRHFTAIGEAGRTAGLRSISKFGKITYQAPGFSGDNTIKNQVISRFIAEESQSRDTAITPRITNSSTRRLPKPDGHAVEVFQLTPLRKAEGLFKGELWLDASTGCRFVKPDGW